jgi:phosphate acetyltransferase
MNAPRSCHTFYLVPAASAAGLTSMALGLARALQLLGVRVGYVKPIAQSGIRDEGFDRAALFARTLGCPDTPDPLAFEHADEMVREGKLAGLMEEVIGLVEPLRAVHDVLIVEGLIPTAEIQIATRLNIAMINSLRADIIPVLAGLGRPVEVLAGRVATAFEQYGDEGRRPIVGAILNHCTDEVAYALGSAGVMDIGQERPVPVIVAAPTLPNLSSPRVKDVAERLGLKVYQAGDIATQRVKSNVVAARSCEKLIAHLSAGALVVTPADRSDAILTTALIAQRGMPIAGFVLTCDAEPAPEVMAILSKPPLDRLPILLSKDDTFVTASRLASLSNHIASDDPDRMERVAAFLAERMNVGPLLQRIKTPGEGLMPPPVFRHRLVQSARMADKRIVLPEGDEPRTLLAAVICVKKKIARCVLLAAPGRVRAVAHGHGIELTPDLEIVDPDSIRRRYIAPMVALRRHRGLTPLQAEIGLEDTVTLGTMMLAQGDVDGLVSGAVHTTASTVRPAMQLIRTAPGASIVSSVFFMLMPDQVLVYGDCAINPDPTSEQLAEIAMQSADSAAAFGIEPRVAMISYSTGSSGTGQDVDKVRRATELVRARRPDLVVDGPIQYDAASVESVGAQKAPGSPLAGHANVFVFPDLNTGNTTYKAVQRSANVVSVGPMLQGLNKPVNDLSRGASVDDIVYTIALTAIQAEAAEKRREALAAE